MDLLGYAFNQIRNVRMTEKNGPSLAVIEKSACRSLETALRDRELLWQQTRCFISLILVLRHSCLGVTLSELLPPLSHQVLKGPSPMLKARVC